MELYNRKHAWILGGFEYLHADDVVADAGAGGATFRTDQLVGGQHVPYTKIMSGTADDAAVIPGDATNGLFVNVKASALPSGASTAAAQSTTNTALAAIQTAVEALDNAVAGAELQVDIVTSALPSGAATSAKQDTEITALQLLDDVVVADDAAFTPGATKVSMAGFQFDDTLPDSVDEGDAGAARMSARREIYTQLRDAAGNERGANVTAGNALKVDGSAVAQPITDNSGSLTIDSAQLPSALGQAAMAASLSVALASNQTALPITDNSGSLTVDNGGTFAVQVDGAALTALQLLDDVVFAEDAAATAADKGIQILAVRRDANTTLVGADNDYAPLQVNADGSLKVAITAGAGSGGTSATDDAAFTVASGTGTPIMGLADETTPDSVDEGDVGVVRMTLTRALHVNLRDSAGVELASGSQYAEDTAHTTGHLGTMSLTVRKNTAAATSDADSDYQPLITNTTGHLWVDASGQTLTVGSHAVTNVGTFAVQAALTAGTNTNEVVGDAAHDAVVAGNPVLVGAYASAAAPTNVSADGDAVRVWADLAGRVQIGDGGGSLTVDNGGTFSVQVSSLPASTNTLEVVGDAAHDAAIAGNPVRLAGRAVSADYTAVATGDTADLITDLNGKQIVMPYAIPENMVSGTTAAITGTADTAVIAAAGVGIRNYITQVLVTNSHATVGTVVELKSAATVVYRGFAAALGGGFAVTFPVPLRLTANEALNAANITTGSNVYVAATGFKAP